MTLDHFRSWFDLLAYDLDPDQLLPRPAFEICIAGMCRYHSRDNVIYLNVIDRSDEEIEFTLAHELRHWLQHARGWIQELRVTDMHRSLRFRGRWHGKEFELFASTQQDYESLPWEHDANMYAHEVTKRLIGAAYENVS